MSSLIGCPFCGKKSVLVDEKPSVLQIKTSRGSGQNSKMTFRTKASTKILKGCLECGKTQKQVENKINGVVSEEDMVGRCVWCKKPCLPERSECDECK